jgi:hypothetical protein
MVLYTCPDRMLDEISVVMLELRLFGSAGSATTKVLPACARAEALAMVVQRVAPTKRRSRNFILVFLLERGRADRQFLK